MKTKVLPLLLLFVATACNNSSVSIPILKFGGLKGDVSTVKESKFDAVEKFGEVVPDDLDEVTIYEYDTDGNQIKFSVYDDDGDYVYKLEDIFEKGLIVEENTQQSYLNKRSTSKVVERKKNYFKWAHEYGTDKQYTTEVFYEGLSLYVRNEKGEKVYESVFDKDGHIIDQKNYDDGNMIHRRQQEFDKKGLLIKQVDYNNTNSSIVHTFAYPEFDKKGNWITQHIFEDGDVVGIVKREITYR